MKSTDPHPDTLRRRWYGLGRSIIETYARSMFKMDVYYHAPLPEGARLLAANHPSTSDPLLMTTLVPEQVSILILDTLFKVPLVGASLNYTQHICVDRANGKAALEKGIRYLREGRTVGIFPEGEISPCEGQFNRARTGAARLALASGAPVIPIGIHLDHDKIKRIESLVDGKKEIAAWYTQGAYTVTVGEPVVFTGDPCDRERVCQVTGEIMEQIAELTRESARRTAQAKALAARPGALRLRPAISPMRLAGWAAPVILQLFPAITGFVVRSFSFMGKVI